MAANESSSTLILIEAGIRPSEYSAKVRTSRRCTSEASIRDSKSFTDSDLNSPFCWQEKSVEKNRKTPVNNLFIFDIFYRVSIKFVSARLFSSQIISQRIRIHQQHLFAQKRNIFIRDIDLAQLLLYIVFKMSLFFRSIVTGKFIGPRP